MKKLSQLVAAFLLIVGLLGSSVALQAFAATHTLQFVETPAIALYSAESFNATSLVVTPVPVDLDGNVLTMASFGSSPTLTVDPGILGAEEIESFTSITNNGNNTATLGGLTRDLQSQYPYGTNGTGQSHGAGATVVFSNNPQLYNRLASWENDGAITGQWNFVTQPTYNTTQVFTNPLALASVGFVLSTAIQGAATSTYTFMGISQLANFGQVGTGVASSTSGAPLVIENKFASSTYNGSTVFQGEIPALRSTKDIDPNFIATSSANTYQWAASTTYSGTFKSFGTTTISALSTTTNPLVLNNIPYAFPSVQGASSTVLNTNGNGSLSWAAIPNPVKYTLIDTSGSAGASSPGSATSYGTSTQSITIPAGTLNASSTISFLGTMTCASGGSGTGQELDLRTSVGVTVASFSVSCGSSIVNFNGIIANQSSTNVQSYYTQYAFSNTPSGSGGTNTINTSNALTLVFVAKITSNSGFSVGLTLNDGVIVVNP